MRLGRITRSENIWRRVNQVWYIINIMLQETNRLKKVRDFNLLMKYGCWANGRFLDLKCLELAKVRQYFPKKVDSTGFVGQLKVAFTVGLKIDKRAVARNRVRRQMREVVRLLVKENRLKTGFYLLFVAKKDILGQEYAAIEKEAVGLLKKFGIL